MSLLADYTDGEIERACREETLIRHCSVSPPADAVRALVRANFEAEINSILHMPDENYHWSKMTDSDRTRLLRDAVWTLGRLALAGFAVHNIAALKRATSHS